MVKAMNIHVGSPLRKIVLLKLADNANDKGECWPSYEHIAKHCEVSKRSVMRHINELIRQNLLKKVTRKNTHGGNSSNLYLLTLEEPQQLKKNNAKQQIIYTEPKSFAVRDRVSPPGDTLSPPGDTLSLNLVTECHPEPVIESINESVNHIVQRWNQTSFQKVLKINARRTEKLNRLLNSFDIDDVMRVIDSAAKNQFLTGRNKSGWKMNFDWFLEEENFLKILEGQYERNSTISTKKSTTLDDWKQRMQARYGTQQSVDADTGCGVDSRH